MSSASAPSTGASSGRPPSASHSSGSLASSVIGTASRRSVPKLAGSTRMTPARTGPQNTAAPEYPAQGDVSSWVGNGTLPEM